MREDNALDAEERFARHPFQVICAADLEPMCPSSKWDDVNAMQAMSALEAETATLDDLIVIEPFLQWLADDAKHYRKTHGRKHQCCANSRWYGYDEWKGIGIKARLYDLVGFGARDPRLRSSYAYDVAYRAIYNMLPDCKKCRCCGYR